jgi:hypothetical protein
MAYVWRLAAGSWPVAPHFPGSSVCAVGVLLGVWRMSSTLSLNVMLIWMFFWRLFESFFGDYLRTLEIGFPLWPTHVAVTWPGLCSKASPMLLPSYTTASWFVMILLW